MITNIAEIDECDGWTKIYQKMTRDSGVFERGFTCLEAKKPENKELNRYRDVSPYDHTRVILRRSGDYINANLVQNERANRKYILTQGPLPLTVSHFWLMVWEQNSRGIIMLNKLVEKNEVKCHRYWPRDVYEIFDDVKLRVERISEENCGYFIIRSLRLIDLVSEESRDVTQFHFRSWPDFGVPTSPVALISFLKRVRSSGTLGPDVGPPVVHCSAGIGRSGTFCLVDCCLTIIENEGMENLNPLEVWFALRRGRMGLIQTAYQLRFAYQAIIEGLRRSRPDWVEEADEVMNEEVEEVEEETPPPPPPRGESLSRPPARPLPAIPASASLDYLSPTSPTSPPPRYYTSKLEGKMNYYTTPSKPLPDVPASALDVRRYLPPPPPTPHNDGDPALDPSDRLPHPSGDESSSTDLPSEGGSLRRRRQATLAERVEAKNRETKEPTRWHSLKRALFNTISVTIGVVLVSGLVYALVKK